MTALSDRKTKLTFETADTARYRGKHREIIVECSNAFTCNVRLKGTRQRLPISYAVIYEAACKLEAMRIRQEKLAKKRGR